MQRLLPLAPLAASGGGAPRRRAMAAAAAGKGSDDKTWGEIAEEAAVVVKDVASKVGQGFTALAKAVTGAGADLAQRQRDAREAEEDRRLRQQKQQQQQQQQEQQGLNFPPQMFGGGLFGRVASGVVSQAARSLASALEAQAREAADVRGAAEAALRASPDLAARLGGAEFEVGPPVSQSSSSVSINGRSERRVALVLPLVDRRSGRVLATARVDASPPPPGGGARRGGGGAATTTTVLDAIPVDVAVTLPTGETIRVGGGRGGGGGGGGGSGRASGGGRAQAPYAPSSSSSRQKGGEVIDAEFKEL